MENAIDADAQNIHVLVTDAGKTCIQVIDDGKGMSETDARLFLSGMLLPRYGKLRTCLLCVPWDFGGSIGIHRSSGAGRTEDASGIGRTGNETGDCGFSSGEPGGYILF